MDGVHVLPWGEARRFGFTSISGAHLVSILPCTGVTGYYFGDLRYQWYGPKSLVHKRLGT